MKHKYLFIFLFLLVIPFINASIYSDCSIYGNCKTTSTTTIISGGNGSTTNSNPFDQSLNTTDNVHFNEVAVNNISSNTGFYSNGTRGLTFNEEYTGLNDVEIYGFDVYNSGVYGMHFPLFVFDSANIKFKYVDTGGRNILSFPFASSNELTFCNSDQSSCSLKLNTTSGEKIITADGSGLNLADKLNSNSDIYTTGNIEGGNITTDNNGICNSTNCYSMEDLLAGNVSVNVTIPLVNLTNVAFTNQSNNFTEKQEFSRNNPSNVANVRLSNYDTNGYGSGFEFWSAYNGGLTAGSFVGRAFGSGGAIDVFGLDNNGSFHQFGGWDNYGRFGIGNTYIYDAQLDDQGDAHIHGDLTMFGNSHLWDYVKAYYGANDYVSISHDGLHSMIINSEVGINDLKVTNFDNMSVPDLYSTGNITTNGDYICNSTACFSLQDLNTTGSGGNSSWNQSLANSLYAPNTTAGIQYLIN